MTCDLEAAVFQRGEHVTQLCDGFLAARAELGLARIEQHVGRQRQRHATAAQFDFELSSVDHALEPHREVAKQAGSSLRGGLRAAQLVHAGSRLGQRAGQRALARKELVDVLALAFQLGAQVLAVSRGFVERVAAGREALDHALELQR
jgi:hypothetical protein